MNHQNSYTRSDYIKKKSKKNSSYISNSNLILLAFATAFFSRIIDYLGAPAAINFLHFATVPFAFICTLLTSRGQEKERLQAIYLLLLGLFIFLIVVIASALLNSAGFINAILEFLLLAEPFLLLTSIVCLSIPVKKITQFKKWLFVFFSCHFLLVFIQKYILKTDTWESLGMVGGDRIQGVFFISGAGHVVGCSVSLTFAVYYLLRVKEHKLWLRILVLLAALWNIILADGKQVLLAFMVAMVILFLLKLNDIILAFKYLLSAIALGWIFWWCIENLKAFSAFNTWIRPELYGPDGEATRLKTAAFRIIPTYYDSILNFFLGLGPGHTVGRLGGWMLPKYADLLAPLGSTVHPASPEVWRATGASWLGSQSSMFSPLFGWAGIWGDLGILGLGAYFYLAYIVWKHVCRSDVTRFLLLTVLVFGCIFSQIEEPGYMLSVACIIGMEYQEGLIKKTQKINL